MKAFIKKMNPEERKAWRIWQAQWIGIYGLLIIAAISIGRWQAGGEQVADVGPPHQLDSWARNVR